MCHRYSLIVEIQWKYDFLLFFYIKWELICVLFVNQNITNIYLLTPEGLFLGELAHLAHVTVLKPNMNVSFSRLCNEAQTG